MPNPIKDELAAIQPWILDAGFRIVSYHDYPRLMGSSGVELESDEFRMYWVRGRGTVLFAELAPAGERLWG